MVHHADPQGLCLYVTRIFLDGTFDDLRFSLDPNRNSVGKIEIQFFTSVLNQPNQIIGKAFTNHLIGQIGGQYDDGRSTLSGSPSLLGLQTDVKIVPIQFDPLTIDLGGAMAIRFHFRD